MDGLRAGDRVEVRRGKAWVPARVAADVVPLVGPAVVRLAGLTAAGRRYPESRVWVHDDIRFPVDRVLSNVVADWLEENGEHSAAALLRKHFPLREEG